MTLLDPHAAAREAGDRPALVLAERDGETIAFGALAATRAPAEADALRVIPATSEPDHLRALYAALAARTPVLPLDPRLAADERDALLAAVRDARRAPVAGANGTAPLAIVATSGTGGAPCGVELSHDAWGAAVRASAAHLGTRRDDLWALALPWAHVGGLAVLLRGLAARVPVLVTGRFEPGRLARALAAHRATLLSLVPAMLDRLLELPDRLFPPSSLRAVLVGGAATPDRLVARARRRGVPVLRTWGMTETCGQVATEPPDRPEAGLRALPGLEVRSRDGRLEVRGPTLATARHPGGPLPRTADGFFRTGDLGEVLEDGRVVVHGRADGRIVSGGEKIVPEQVEAVLLDLPWIAEAVVFGVEDDRWGQIVAAALVACGPRPDDEALAGAIAARLGPARRPRRVAWLDELPRRGPGKPDRRACAALAGGRLQALHYGER
ncbi:MAG: hypothetical protein D6738_15350 [Acidobacteria bacterium]|nr:MAG: hypothetical protein D6738_15350 [Acidobacteriota bacterium]